MLHKVLEYAGRHIKGLGTEWFQTNPNEVAMLYRRLCCIAALL